jgi:hypothetical protein
MIHREHAGKRAWFIERNERGRWTLRGGWPKEMMREDPTLREMDIGMQFVFKEDLLRDLDEIGFCIDNDKVIIDGIPIVRW